MAVLAGYISDVYEEINDELPKEVFKRFAKDINAQMQYLRETYKVDDYLSAVTQIFDETPQEIKYNGVDINKFDNPENKEIVAVMAVLIVGNIKKDLPRRFIDEMPVLNYKGYYNSFWEVNDSNKLFVCAIYKD